MILIISSRRDGHVGAVTTHINAAGMQWVRVNTEDFATNVEVDLSPTEGNGSLFIKDSGKLIQLRDVEAVWYRKPDPVDLRHFDLEGGASEYVEAEFTEVIMGLYALLHRARWINNPFDTRLAHRKLLQLKTAASVGFSVPRSLLTNRLESALQFAADSNDGLAIKSLGAISVVEDGADGPVQFGIFTRRVQFTELGDVRDKIRHVPTLYQHFLPKKSELRITCVGPNVFACEIQTRLGEHHGRRLSLRHGQTEALGDRLSGSGRSIACLHEGVRS
jgi:hypothetical protein